MKTALRALLLLCAAAARAADVPGQSETWVLDEPVYAQVCAVPSVEKGMFRTREWAGPAKPFQKFLVAVDSSPARQTEPKPYEFVLPVIFLRALSDTAVEGTSFPLHLFDGPSKTEDIQVDFTPLKGPPRLDTEIKVATISSPLSEVRWEIFVRFTTKKPAGVK